MVTLYSAITAIISVGAYVILIIAIIFSISKKRSKKQAKMWWLIFAIYLVVGGSLGVWMTKEKLLAEQKANAPVYLYSSEEEDVLEDEIVSYLEDLNMFSSTYAGIKVSSGYTKNNGDEIIEEKTKIYIIMNGNLAEDVSEGKAIAEGYGVAMTLYFGEREIENYDIHVQFAGKYKFLNGELVEEE